MSVAPPRPAVLDAATADEFFDALTRADEQRAVDLAVDLVEAGVPATEVLLRLVGPAQERIGRLWQAGEWSVAQEHAATCIDERVVAAVGARVRGRGDRGHVVLGCLDGEWHALPARIVGEVLREHGWRVTFLGASVPPAHLVSYLHEHGPDVVAVSCALPMHLPGAHRTIAAAQRTGTPVLAGGPGFGADGRWARKLGVDAFAGTAAEAVQILDGASWSPTPAAVPETGGVEYAGLRGRRAGLVRDVVARLDRTAPLGDGDAYDDAAQLVDSLAAAVYLEDPELFTDHVAWLATVATARRGGLEAVRAALDALDAGLHDFPLARDGLTRARAAVAPEATR